MKTYPAITEKKASNPTTENLRKNRIEVKNNSRVPEVIAVQVERCLPLELPCTIVIHLVNDVEKEVHAIEPREVAKLQAQHNKSKLALDEERRELKDQKNKIRAMYSDLLSEKALFEEEKRKSAEAMKKAEAMRKECAEAMKKAEATRKEYAEAAQMGKHLMFALEHGGISPEKESMIRSIIAEAEMAYNAIEQVHDSESASDKKHFG